MRDKVEEASIELRISCFDTMLLHLHQAWNKGESRSNGFAMDLSTKPNVLVIDLLHVG